ncbi:MAG: type II secretion system protein N [Parasphingopyxis sp.]|uniref:type II secretion system protein N n=1 Tax=Parasphingopyxis sp. TaxID=1920299 RepID=UPI0032F0650B
MTPEPALRETTSGWLSYDPDAPTSPKRLAILAGVAALLLLVILWSMGGDETAASEAGAPAPAVAPPPAPPQPAPQTVTTSPAAAPGASSSQVVLHGVMGGATDGSAIVSVGGAQRLVRVGRDIEPGLRLVSIGADHIIVDERGTEVRIAFLDAVPRSPVASAATPGGRQPNRPNTADALSREAVQYQAGMQAAQDGAGFTITRGRVPSAFAALGLQPGDRVLRVGGTELESPDDVERIPRELAGDEPVPIEIIHDGRRQTVMAEPR